MRVKIMVTVKQNTTANIRPLSGLEPSFSRFEEVGGNLCWSALTTENSHLLDKF